VSLVVIACVALLPNVLGFRGRDGYTVAVDDPAMQPVADAAVRQADAFDAEVQLVDGGDADATLARSGIRAQEKPEDKLLNVLQAANAQVRSADALREAGLDDGQAAEALSPPPLKLTTTEPIDLAAEERGGFAFFAVLLLYGQLIGMGYFVAMGVVEEKSSRVVELLLSTLRPRHLLAGKILGLGLLGLGQLLLLAVLGLAVAGAGGALDVNGDVIVAAGLALVWFVVGYAFYAAAFACAASLVSRQEDLQSVLTPLTLVLMVGFFVSFGVAGDPSGTLAQVVSFIPPVAPMTMPPRIALGEASAFDVAGALAVTLVATALLIPLAARIYSGAVLRTGGTIKLREAWRAARA
jgi:ABC-2 type transport system permease protein